MPTAQSAPSEAAAAARAVLNARKQPPTAPPPADAEDDSEEEGAAPRRPSRADAFLLSPLRRGTPRLDRRQNRARRALLRRRARQDVPVRPRRLPGDVRVGARAQRIRLGRRAHVRGEDGSGGVRHRHGLPGQAARRVHIPAQSAVQPEVQGAHRGVRRRRFNDWRRVHQPQRFLHRHDHRGAAWVCCTGAATW